MKVAFVAVFVLAALASAKSLTAHLNLEDHVMSFDEFKVFVSNEGEKKEE